MASVRKKGRYNGYDLLDEFLLNQVAKFIKYGQLGPLSRDLKVSQVDYEKITAPNTFSQNDQIYKVLDKWLQHLPQNYNIRDFIDDVICWYRVGYLDTGVWNHLQKYVQPELLPQITDPSGGRTELSMKGVWSYIRRCVELLFLWITALFGLTAGPSMTGAAQYLLITEKEFAEIKRWNKESLIFRCRNCLSHDWLPDDKSRSFSLRGYYVNLDWLKTIKHVMRDERVPMRRIHDVFMNLKPNQPVRILIIGEPGSGKTCSMKMLAMDWAEDKAPTELKLFDFVFLVALKNVNKNIPLEDIILQQHGRMRNMGVSKEQIKSFIQKKKVLILLDGYDEYRKGTNTDIDNAITDSLGCCFILVTSRPGDYMTKADRDQMDGEVEITGFSDEAVTECSTKYLGNEKKSRDFQHKCSQSGIRELLHIPIVLLMLCVLYYANKMLPNRKTDIVWEIVKMYVNRAKRRFPEVRNFDELLFKLGKLSWEALQRKRKQLLINKDELCIAGKDIMKLGLLFSTLEGEEASVGEQPDWLTYPHKLFQDFAAGFYVSRTKEPLQSLFPSWNDILYYREVVLFAVGLMSDPTPLVDHVYQMWINDKLEEMRKDRYYSSSLYDTDLLKSLYTESQVQLPGHPLHNRHINYYDHVLDDFEKRPRDTTAIYLLSKVYMFENIKHDIVLGTEHTEQEAEISKGTLIIYEPDKAVTQSLLSNCQVIMRNQAINNLIMVRVGSTDFPQTFAFNISKHIQSLALYFCNFPSQTLNHLMQQIKECRALREIDLQFTGLEDVSSLTLSNKTSLTHLNLRQTYMSRELSRSVCHQLADLTQLKHLNLSMNDLSHIDMIHLSNKPNLSYLDCRNTQMSTKLGKNVISQIRHISHLSELHLSFNNLTGCLSSFLPDPHPGLPELKELCLGHTALKKDDLQHLTHLIQTHKLPGLETLDLNDNRLCEMETDVEHLIEACVTHHQRELRLRMRHNDFSASFREKWKQRCAGTHITLSFAVTDI